MRERHPPSICNLLGQAIVLNVKEAVSTKGRAERTERKRTFYDGKPIELQSIGEVADYESSQNDINGVAAPMRTKPANTVLIADNHLESREELRLLLQLDAEMEIVAETDNGAEAIQLSAALNPRIALIDLELRDMGGMQAARRIKSEHPGMTIVIQAESADVRLFFEALKAGAQGYLLKSLHPASRHEYLRSILIEGATLSREIGFQILEPFVAGNPSRNGKVPLTPIETAFVRYLCQGYRNQEIAAAMLLTESAVKIVLKDILFKLKLKNRLQLVRYAYETGIYSTDATPNGDL